MRLSEITYKDFRKWVIADLHLVPEKVQAQTGNSGCNLPAHNPHVILKLLRVSGETGLISKEGLSGKN